MSYIYVIYFICYTYITYSHEQVINFSFCHIFTRVAFLNVIREVPHYNYAISPSSQVYCYIKFVTYSWFPFHLDMQLIVYLLARGTYLISSILVSTRLLRYCIFSLMRNSYIFCVTFVIVYGVLALGGSLGWAYSQP